MNSCILHAPTVLIAGTEKTHGTYFHFFRSLACHTCGIADHMDRHYKALSVLTAVPYDLLVLPGGGDFPPSLYSDFCHPSYRAPSQEKTALDILQTALLADAVARAKSIIGICKGMQLLNVCFGGTLSQDIPGDLHPYADGDRIHSIQTVSKAQLQQLFPPGRPTADQTALWRVLSDIRTVNSAHHQAVCRLADDFVCIQQAPDGVAETILHRTRPIIGFQWHPERCRALPRDAAYAIVHLLLER